MCCCSRASTTCGHPQCENQVVHVLPNGREICWAIHPGSIIRPKAEEVNRKGQVLIIDFKINQDILKKMKRGDSNRQSMLVISSQTGESLGWWLQVGQRLLQDHENPVYLNCLCVSWGECHSRADPPDIRETWGLLQGQRWLCLCQIHQREGLGGHLPSLTLTLTLCSIFSVFWYK